LDIQCLSLGGGGGDNQDAESVKIQQMLLDQYAKDREVPLEGQSPVSTTGVKEEVKGEVV